MSYALFNVNTGKLVETFEDESEARVYVRTMNTYFGFKERVGFHWTDGIEIEKCVGGISNYGITDFERWKNKFSNTTHSIELEEDLFDGYERI